MKRKNLIIMVSSLVMLIAYFVLPTISGIRIPEYDPFRTQDAAHTMFDMLTGQAPTIAFLMFLLLLLAPLCLLPYAFRNKLKKKAPFVAKLLLPQKIAYLLPLILIISLRLLMKSFMQTGTDLSRTPVFGSGFYLYLIAAIVVAVLLLVRRQGEQDAKGNRK